ncbi:uncharacterized protein MEPE_02504 [Melanopsichium pennsylvanicum]|uniref:Uncharacterized protein n=1 Tax=Melanopsichium pennsylvanicum TaxID=63383 RepID=A0AAJ4XKT6_9BASI|nr:uncharacterized protein MEPE_02504 [Melanopsichium pennsylvanicum]
MGQFSTTNTNAVTPIEVPPNVPTTQAEQACDQLRERAADDPSLTCATEAQNQDDRQSVPNNRLTKP